MEFIRSPHKLHINSSWSPFWTLTGQNIIYMEFFWSLCGVYLEYLDSRWSPCGVYVEYVESRWSFYGSVGECKIQESTNL